MSNELTSSSIQSDIKVDGKKSGNGRLYLSLFLVLIGGSIIIWYVFFRNKKYKCSEDKCIEVAEDESGDYVNSDCNDKCKSNKPPNVPQPTYNCIPPNGSEQICTKVESGEPPGQYLTSECNGNCNQLPIGLKYECRNNGEGNQFCMIAPSSSCSDPSQCYENSDCDGVCQPEPSETCSGQVIDDSECDIECGYLRYEITQKLQGNPSNIGCSEIINKQMVEIDNDGKPSRPSVITKETLKTFNNGDIITVICDNNSSDSSCSSHPDNSNTHRYKCIESECKYQDPENNNWENSYNSFENLHDCLSSSCNNNNMNFWFISDDICKKETSSDEIANSGSCFNSFRCLSIVDNEEIYNDNALPGPKYDSKQECIDSLDHNMAGQIYTGMYVKRQVIQGMEPVGLNKKNGRIDPYINPVCGHNSLGLDELYTDVKHIEPESTDITQEIKELCYPVVEEKLNNFIIENKEILEKNKKIYDDNCEEEGDNLNLAMCTLINSQIEEYESKYDGNLQPSPLNNTIGTEDYTVTLRDDILKLPDKYIVDDEGLIILDDMEILKNDRTYDINNLKNGSQYQCIPTNNPDESQYRLISLITEPFPSSKETYDEKIIDVLYDCEQSLVDSSEQVGGSTLSKVALDNSWGYFMGASGIPALSTDIYNNLNKDSSKSSTVKNIPDSMLVKPIIDGTCNDVNENKCKCDVEYNGTNKTCASSCLVSDLNEWMPQDCGERYSGLNNCGLEARDIILGPDDSDKPDICLDGNDSAWFPSTETEDKNYCFGTKYKNIDTNGSGDGDFKYGNYTPYDFNLGQGKCIYRKITRNDIIEQENAEILGDTWKFESQGDCEENWKCQQVLPNEYVDYCANNSSRSPCRGDGDNSHCGPGKDSDYQETIDYPYKYINWNDRSGCSGDICRVCTKRGFGGDNNIQFKPTIKDLVPSYDTRTCFQFDKGGSTYQSDCVKYW